MKVNNEIQRSAPVPVGLRWIYSSRRFIVYIKSSVYCAAAVIKVLTLGLHKWIEAVKYLLVKLLKLHIFLLTWEFNVRRI